MRPVDLTRPEPLEDLRLRLVGRADVGLALRDRRGHDPRGAQPLGPGRADRVPAGEIPRAIRRDHLGRRLHGEVGRREGDILEEGRAAVVAGVVGQALHGVVADGRRHIEVVAGRDRLSVYGHPAGVKKVALAGAEHVERAGEALLPRVTIDVPFPGVVGAVARGREPLGQELRPPGPPALRTPLASRQRVAANGLRVVAREQGRPRGPAPRGAVALGEAEPAGGQPVEVRRVDLAAVGPEVGEAQVVGEDHEHVRSGWLGGVEGRGEGYQARGECEHRPSEGGSCPLGRGSQRRG